jgi:7-carboxy-7-deazaguanine synthase
VRLPAVEDRTRMLVVNEIFGPTIQGEGPSAGQLAMFIRLFGCPLRCQWCDTAWTWDHTHFDLAAEQHVMSIGAVMARLSGFRPGLVVISGGEPLLQQDAVTTLVTALSRLGTAVRVEVETAGVLPPSPELASMVSAFNVSPKLTHSGMRLQQRIRPDVLRQFAATGKAAFKFVVRELADLDEISELTQAYGLEPVWVMPEGCDSSTIITRLRALAGPVIARGWNLSPRLQVLLWEDERGR